MRYLLFAVLGIFAIGLFAVPGAFADANVTNAPGSSTPGCEETDDCFIPSTVTIGVGDNQNDIEMLKLCDHPCLVRNDNFNSALINIDNLIKSAEPSPMGWADVIKTAIQKIES